MRMRQLELAAAAQLHHLFAGARTQYRRGLGLQMGTQASAELPRRFRRVRVKLHGSKASKPGFGTLKLENPTCLLLG